MFSQDRTSGRLRMSIQDRRASRSGRRPLRVPAAAPALLAGCLAVLAVAVPAVSPVFGAVADHLLVAEIQTLANAVTPPRPLCAEFIEVVNPTAGSLDLTDVYLTDATFASGSQFYWRIAEGSPTTATAGGGAFSDFHARFPAGYTIAAGDTVVIAVTGSAMYQAAYGKLPDLELFEDGSAPDQVPEMVEAFPGSISAGLVGGGNSPTLSDGSESLVLYTWDGSGDLVSDLDFAFWGASTNVLFDKTGVTVGAGTYQPDTPTSAQQAITAATLVFGESYMRTGADEGAETATGGNGSTGHDETSERLASTWQVAAVQDPARAPGDFFPTAPIITAHSAAPAAPYTGQEVVLSLTALSYSALSQVTFHVAYDRGPFNPVTGTAAGAGVYTATLPGKPEGTHVAWYAVARNADGAEAVYPAGGEDAPEEWTVAAEPLPSEGPFKLLITEVNAGPNFYPDFTGMADLASELIEIHNPNDFAVDLGNYYLTDAISYVSGTQVYWQITQSATEGTIGGGNYNDFTARFPEGYTVEAHQTIVIALAGSGWYSSVYSAQPDLELYEDGTAPDDIPDMRPVFTNTSGGNSIYTPGRPAGSDGLPRGIPELEEFYGEPVILYFWDGESDLVTDVDFFVFGEEKTGTYRISFDKSGINVGSSTYLSETPVPSQIWYVPVIEDASGSYTRMDVLEAGQTASGSNGVDGRDETSEDLATNFIEGPATPGFFHGAGGGTTDIGATVELVVPAATFIPTLGEAFTIRFVTRSDSETKLRIFDLEGRLVASLFDSRFGDTPSVIPGAYTVKVWDGRDQDFERVKAGMYVVHLSVVSNESGDEITKTAPAVVATRLSN